MNNSERLRAVRVAYLWKSYGMTPEDYQHLFDYQQGVCAICKQESPNRRLAVDHLHQHRKGRMYRGKVFIRGLLCYKCNRFLIAHHQNSALFRQAIQYLEHPPAQDILLQKPSKQTIKKVQ